MKTQQSQDFNPSENTILLTSHHGNSASSVSVELSVRGRNWGKPFGTLQPASHTSWVSSPPELTPLREATRPGKQLKVTGSQIGLFYGWRGMGSRQPLLSCHWHGVTHTLPCRRISCRITIARQPCGLGSDATDLDLGYDGIIDRAASIILSKGTWSSEIKT